MMNHTLESLIRFVNLTTSGLLAGSLGFGEQALVPGWRHEIPQHGDHRSRAMAALTAVTLAVGSRGVKPMRRALDAASAIGLAGVLAATIMVTVPINKELDEQAPTDYPSDRSQSLAKNWSRAHAVRTTLGVGAFLCAVASNLAAARHAK